MLAAIVIIFSVDCELVYCNDVEGLLQELECAQNPAEWIIFVDSPSFILKALLLHNRNIHPIAHSVQMMDFLLKVISY
jgi:hypothetical protein